MTDQLLGGRPGLLPAPRHAPTNTPCTRPAARAPSSVVCPRIFGRIRPARAEKSFIFNAAAAQGMPKYAHGPQTRVRAHGLLPDTVILSDDVKVKNATDTAGEFAGAEPLRENLFASQR